MHTYLPTTDIHTNVHIHTYNKKYLLRVALIQTLMDALGVGAI